jgi:Tfp pilus assembly protein FimV
MSVPQKEKEGPATMLRAMFAGVGSLLSIVDRVRGKSTAQAPAPAAAAPAETAAPEETAATETVVAETATPEETAAPETAAPETVVAETVVAETATPEETAATKDTAAPEATAAPETVAELPLANYDESTVASLRARLRNLTVAQLTQLVEYEKGHAARADVITMFERRIAKIESEA